MTNPSTNADDRTPSNSADDQSPSTRSDAQPPADRSPLAAIVVERDVGPDQCTIYPEGASDDDLVTQWITAEEGSYVDVESMR